VGPEPVRQNIWTAGRNLDDAVSTCGDSGLAVFLYVTMYYYVTDFVCAHHVEYT